MERRTRSTGPLAAAGYILATLLLVTVFVLPGLYIPYYWMIWATAFVLFILLGTLRYYLSIGSSFISIKEPTGKARPAVDIIVPVFDEARVLPRNLRSMTGQRYRGRIRVIYLVDSDTSDHSRSIIDRIARIDDRVEMVEYDGDAGKVPTLNAARDLVNSDIIGFIDADVSLAPDFVSRAVSHLTGGMDAVKGRSTPINKSSNLMTATIGAERDIRERVEYYSKYAIGGFSVLTGGNFFIRRTVLDKLGWFDENILTEDMDLAARLQIDGYKLGHDPRMMAHEEAPGGVRDWYAQRHRWYRGWIQGSRKNLRSALRSKELRGFHLADTLFLLSSTLIAPSVVLYYCLTVLKTLGMFGGAVVPYEIQIIASSISLFTPLAILLVAYHDRKEGRRFPWVELPAIILILPYLIIYSIAAWHAFLDEYIFRRPNIYRKYPRTGYRDTVRPARK